MYIQTRRGPEQIQDLVPGDEVYSWDDGKPRLARITRLNPPRRQMTYRLRTLHREIIASGNHPFLTLRRTGQPLRSKPSDYHCTKVGCDDPGYARGVCRRHYNQAVYHGQLDTLPAPRKGGSGKARAWELAWVELKDLRRNDIIVTLRSLPDNAEPPDDPLLADKRFLWLLGLAFGDGSLYQKAVKPNRVDLCVFGELREEVQDRLEDLIGKRGTPTAKHGLYLYDKMLASGFRQYGMEARSIERRPPRQLWTLPHGHIQRFLDGYTAADGHRLKRASDPALNYKAANRGLIADVRNLQMIIGHNVTRVRELKRTRPIVIRGIEVKNARSLWTFEAYETGRKLTSAGARLFGGSIWVAEQFPEDSHFAPQKITSIEPLGEDDTYDITVEGSYSFVAEGLVVHTVGT